MYGKCPFPGKNLVELAENIVSRDPEVDRRLPKVSTPAREILKAMLDKDPKKRPTVEKLLQYAWLNEAHKAELSDKPFEKEVFTNLMTIHSETHFKKFVMRMISEKMSPTKLRQLEQTFSQADLNGDGMISLSELKKFIETHPDLAEEMKQLDGTGETIESVFAELDGDSSGQISIHEFIASTLDAQSCLVHSVLWDAFKALDQNHDGKLSKKELRTVVKEVGGRLGQDHLNDMVKLIEWEVTGDMSFEEFCHMMQEEGGRHERRHGTTCGRIVKSMNACKMRA